MSCSGLTETWGASASSQDVQPSARTTRTSVLSVLPLPLSSDLTALSPTPASAAS